MRGLPGVERASISETVPLAGNGRSSYARGDREVPPPSERPVAPLHNVSADYFATLGISLLAGRNFDERDVIGHPLVAIISDSTAKRLFPAEDPIGRPLYIGNNNGIGDRVQIIGVVSDVRTLQVAIANDAELYQPWSQDNKSFMSLAVRSALQPNEITKMTQSVLKTIDPDIPIFQTQPMTQIVDTSLGQTQLVTVLLGCFAVIAIALATIGIYGAVALVVAQRTGEIGIRVALGAQTRDILILVLSQGMKPVMAGLATGLLLSLALGQLLAAQLYHVSPRNPLLLAGTAGVLGIASVLACLIPAARASQINPLEALRTE
jgi:predicted permease